MAYPDADPLAPALDQTTPAEPAQGTELAQALINRREAGEDVDEAIQALLDDLERLGLTGTDAYLMLDAYRPGVAAVAAPEEGDDTEGPEASTA